MNRTLTLVLIIVSMLLLLVNTYLLTREVTTGYILAALSNVFILIVGINGLKNSKEK